MRVRACDYEGRRYLYAVNTGATPADVTLRLDAYELRSFSTAADF